MKNWENDLLDHLVFLVIQNAESASSEKEVRDELKQELGRLLRHEEPVRPLA